MLISLLLFLAVMLLAAAPVWPYSRAWGYLPSTGIGAILLLAAVLGFLHVL